MKTREERNIIRHDMIHLMMQARKDASALENPDNGTKRKLGIYRNFEKIMSELK